MIQNLKMSNDKSPIKVARKSATGWRRGMGTDVLAKYSNYIDKPLTDK